MGTIQPSRFLLDTGQILPGVVRIVAINNPLAGADFSVIVPAGVMWRIATAQATLTTSAAVATRIPQIQLTSQGVNVGVYTGTVTAPATTVSVVSFSQCLAASSSPAGALNSVISLPTYPLTQGDTIGSVTAAVQAGDQWSAIRMVVEEFYFTNAQLSEVEREIRGAQLMMERYEQSQAQAGGGN